MAAIKLPLTGCANDRARCDPAARGLQARCFVPAVGCVLKAFDRTDESQTTNSALSDAWTRGAAHCCLRGGHLLSARSAVLHRNAAGCTLGCEHLVAHQHGGLC